MKPLITAILFILLSFITSSAQNAQNKGEMAKINKYIKADDREGYMNTLRDIIANTNSENINQKLTLYDNIYNVINGSYADASDTVIDVLRRNYLPELLKYLTNRKESNFETAYITFMVGKLKYSVQKQVASSNFEASINKILPSLTPKEKAYVVNLKEQILLKAN